MMSRLINLVFLVFSRFSVSLAGMVKVGLSTSKNICSICLDKSPLKIIKNAFYFILKALFILKIFKFLL